MKRPFRTSLTARGFAATASFALLGAGLIPILGLWPGVLPLVLVTSVGLAFGSLMAGAADHPGEVALLAILGPLAFFVYVCGALVVVEEAPRYAWVLVALAAVPTIFLSASLGLREDAPDAAPTHASHARPLSA
jgi:hypothetical protein